MHNSELEAPLYCIVNDKQRSAPPPPPPYDFWDNVAVEKELDSGAFGAINFITEPRTEEKVHLKLIQRQTPKHFLLQSKYVNLNFSAIAFKLPLAMPRYLGVTFINPWTQSLQLRFKVLFSSCTWPAIRQIRQFAVLCR